MYRPGINALVVIAGFCASVSLLAAPRTAAAESPAVFTGYIEGVGVGGYDVVSYFLAGKPEKGSADIRVEHEGIEYRFASVAHRDAFAASPGNYLPQYGGYCAYAVSQGAAAAADPQVWNVVDGKLYLNYSDDVRSTWRKDPEGYISKANENWPKVLE